MWKEFTREKPARRGWTLVTMCLAFIGTVSLAKIMVDVRTDNDLAVSGRQTLPDWPIAFTLPGGYRWHIDPNSYLVAGEADPGQGTLAYLGQGVAGGRSELVIGFQVMPPGMPLAEATTKLAGRTLDGGEQIEMGPISGLMATMPLGLGRTQVFAVGYAPQGLGIVVNCVAQGRTADVRRLVQAICTSIAFKEWRGRR